MKVTLDEGVMAEAIKEYLENKGFDVKSINIETYTYSANAEVELVTPDAPIDPEEVDPPLPDDADEEAEAAAVAAAVESDSEDIPI